MSFLVRTKRRMEDGGWKRVRGRRCRRRRRTLFTVEFDQVMNEITEKSVTNIISLGHESWEQVAIKRKLIAHQEHQVCIYFNQNKQPHVAGPE